MIPNEPINNGEIPIENVMHINDSFGYVEK